MNVSVSLNGETPDRPMGRLVYFPKPQGVETTGVALKSDHLVDQCPLPQSPRL